MADCVFCGEKLSNGARVSTLTGKGCEGISKASDTACDNIKVEPGQKVHTSCRKDYLRYGSRRKRLSPADDRKQNLRSNKGTFSYIEHCLFCGTGDRYGGRQKDHLLITIRTFDFQDMIKMKCVERADEWG